MSAGWNHILDASITMWPVYITCVAASARAYVLVKSHSSSGYLTNVKILQVIWLVVSTPLKKILVSWDHYSQYMENVPNHQSVLSSRPSLSPTCISSASRPSRAAAKETSFNMASAWVLGEPSVPGDGDVFIEKWWWTKKHRENNVGISWDINNQLNIIDYLDG